MSNFVNALKSFTKEILKKDSDFSVPDGQPFRLHLLRDIAEIFEDEDGIMIYAPFGQFGAIQSYLEEQKLEILLPNSKF